MTGPSLRILFASPAYWPALAFGGPIWMARELNEGMIRRGHAVDVVTTSLVDLERPGARRTATRSVDGVSVHYLATPARYRWMGVTPSLPLVLRRLPRPDVVHVFGYRDPVGTAVAAWAALLGVPYVFEPLGMHRPKLRKVRTKRLLDALVAGRVARGAAAVVATSEFERRELVEAGIPPSRIDIRGNGFPPPLAGETRGALRSRIGVGEAPLLLYVGRVARGKGIDLLLAAARSLDGVHVALVGPDGGDGTAAAVRAAGSEPALRGRVHHLPPPSASERPLDWYADAEVFVLASEGESFGMSAAEAAAAGTPVVLTDRCGVADVLGGRGALVVPYEPRAVREAVARLLADPALRRALGEQGRAVAAELSWDVIVARQEAVYRRVASASGRRDWGRRDRP
ncbi:MAG: glycosyltransferase [Thermoleophilia bacterium]|nr:glycosyltransferase [Thermoleophilia bacterium]